MDILIGVLSSLVATIIWVFVTILYDFYSRKNINYLLDLAHSTLCQFYNAMEINEYELAISQIDRVQDFIREIHTNIKKLTYIGNKRKLILTLLYNINRFTEVIKNVAIGYNGQEELLARCNRINRHYLYATPELEKINTNVMCFSILLLQSLNKKTCNVKAGLTDRVLIGNDKSIDLIELYMNLIELNSFKQERYPYPNKYDLRKELFKQSEYERYIRKTLKKAKSNFL